MKPITIATLSAMFLAGSASAIEINVPGDYASINEAVNNALSGDIVTIDAGTYLVQRIDVYEAQAGVSIVGAVNKDGSPAVVLRPDAGVVRCLNIYAARPATTLIENLVIDEFVSTGTGTGAYLDNSNVTVRNCVFRNHQTGGTPVCLRVGTYEFHDCLFENNHSLGVGGGARVDAAVGSFYNCSFINNVANDRGGAFVAYDIPFEAYFDGCLFSGNEAVNGGGAMMIEAINDGISDVFLSNTTLTGNHAPKGGAVWLARGTLSGGELYANTAKYGGGIYFNYFDASISGVTVRDNVALINGGGVYTSASVDEYPDVIATTVCGNTPNQVWHIEGDNTNIINESCSSNPAACCVNGACIMVEPLMCGDVGGTLMSGGEEDCNATQCAEPCLGDVNNDSEINVNDLLTVIANWGGCP